MKRLIFSISCLFLSLALFSLRELNAGVMGDYCIVPPYVVQDVAPNVMIVLDNSGSMFNFAYFDGFNTTTASDDNMCDSSTSPCTGFTDPGTYPTYKYYGYFDPDYWYTYSSRFVPAGPKSGTRPANSWDGNFLNWLTMRRVDVIRKVMAGGKSIGSGANTRLLGQIADYAGRGIYKQIANASDYTPYSGSKTFTFSTGGSATSSFSVSGVSGTFSVDVVVPPPVEGVLQKVVGTRARVGLTFYNVNNPTPQGGKIRVSVGGGSLSSTINEINNDPSNSMGKTNTPLAETLWTVAGYFAQQSTITPVGSPGPMYSSGDYQINNNNDPLNYGTGGSPRWPSCAKSYVLYITDGEPCADGYLPATLSNYASGRSDYNCSGTGCPAVGSFPASTFPSCTGGGESASCGGIVSGCYVAGIEDVALWMHTTDLRNNGGTPDIGVNNMSGIQNLTLYVVFAFGKGSTLLKYAAINGGFEDANGNNIPDQQSEWDSNGDNEPDTFYEADEGYALEQSIKDAFSSILKRASSGTAASVLASGEGSGANLVQAVFYPRRMIGNDIISWVGESKNFWYYVDPYFTNSNIRENTTQDSPYPILNLTNDYIARFYFDSAAQLTKARRYLDSNGDGVADSEITPPVIFENVINLWEAGTLLWSRTVNPSNPADTNNRTIFTTIDGSTLLTNNFTVTNKTTLRPYLQAIDDTEADYIIRYMHGEGLTTLRDENGVILIAGIDRKGNCSITVATSCTIDADCPSGETCTPDGIDDYRSRYANIGGTTNVWKLGDVLNSTPKLVSWIKLNDYNKSYHDTTYGPENDPLLNDPPDPTKFIATADYKNRGMVFAGGNDGMLHAFKLGKLELTWSGMGGAEKARLSGSDLGKEVWAFIPKNALPYLKYFTDPNYCHVFTVDLSPFIFDASINNPVGCTGDYWECTRDVSSWRTILIGGMRYGGACRGTTTACTDVSGDGSKDCVNTPIDIGGSSIGYSSYFALDITDTVSHPDDPVNHPPVLLWEFSNPQLGFATTGPAVVKIVTDVTKNGKWFVVLGSGPTGPIDTTKWQFLGRSDQNLRLFVLDLKTGSLLRTIDTAIPYAFAGSMINSTYDHKLANYRDDAVYIGYVKRTGTSPNYTWTDGGVGRLVTKENTDVNQWEWSQVIDGIGPVTSSITHLYHIYDKKAWLYFGTGRYYFELGTSTDDASGQRRLFGIKEPCVTQDGDFNLASCSTVTFGQLTDRTTLSGDITEPDKGWYINLDPSTNTGTPLYHAERVITDPLASPSAATVFYTTYKPYNDECGIGGKSYIWAVEYNTGGSRAAYLKGVALLQVSTGSIEQINLSSAFTEKSGRRTSGMEGVPPTSQGITVMGQTEGVKRIIHIRER